MVGIVDKPIIIVRADNVIVAQTDDDGNARAACKRFSFYSEAWMYRNVWDERLNAMKWELAAYYRDGVLQRKRFAVGA